MTKALGVSVLVLSFLIGLSPQSAADPLMMLPFVLLAGWMMGSGTLAQLSLRDPFLLILTLLWVLWSLSTISSPVPFPSKVTWVIMGTFPLSYLAWRSLHLSDLEWGRVTKIFTFIFSALSLWGISQILPLSSASPQLARAEGPFEDANLLGGLLGMGFLLGIPLAFSSPRIFTIPLLLIFSGVLASQSRSAIFALCLCLPFFFVSYRNSAKKFLFLLIPLAVLLVVFTGFHERIFSLWQEGGDRDVNARFALWQAGGEMAREHPLTGLGLGTFHLHYPPYRLADDISAGWWVHMDPLQQAIESGWAAMFLLYGLFILAVFRFNTPSFLSQRKNLLPPLLFFFLIMHTAYPFHVVPFMILLAGVFSRFSEEEETKEASRFSLFLGSCLLLLLSSALWAMFQTATTLYLYRQVELAAHSQEEARFQSAMGECIQSGDPEFPDCRLLAAQILIRDSDPIPPRIFALLNEAESANPLSPAPPYFKALALQKMDKAERKSVQDYLFLSLSRNPSFFPARRKLVENFLAEGDTSRAENILTLAKNYPLSGTDIAAFYYLEAQIKKMETKR